MDGISYNNDEKINKIQSSLSSSSSSSSTLQKSTKFMQQKQQQSEHLLKQPIQSTITLNNNNNDIKYEQLQVKWFELTLPVSLLTLSVIGLIIISIILIIWIRNNYLNKKNIIKISTETSVEVTSSSSVRRISKIINKQKEKNLLKKLKEEKEEFEENFNDKKLSIKTATVPPTATANTNKQQQKKKTLLCKKKIIMENNSEKLIENNWVSLSPPITPNLLQTTTILSTTTTTTATITNVSTATIISCTSSSSLSSSSLPSVAPSPSTSFSSPSTSSPFTSSSSSSTSGIKTNSVILPVSVTLPLSVPIYHQFKNSNSDYGNFSGNNSGITNIKSDNNETNTKINNHQSKLKNKFKKISIKDMYNSVTAPITLPSLQQQHQSQQNIIKQFPIRQKKEWILHDTTPQLTLKNDIPIQPSLTIISTESLITTTTSTAATKPMCTLSESLSTTQNMPPTMPQLTTSLNRTINVTGILSFPTSSSSSSSSSPPSSSSSSSSSTLRNNYNCLLKQCRSPKETQLSDDKENQIPIFSNNNINNNNNNINNSNNNNIISVNNNINLSDNYSNPNSPRILIQQQPYNNQQNSPLIIDNCINLCSTVINDSLIQNIEDTGVSDSSYFIGNNDSECSGNNIINHFTFSPKQNLINNDFNLNQSPLMTSAGYKYGNYFRFPDVDVFTPTTSLPLTTTTTTTTILKQQSEQHQQQEKHLQSNLTTATKTPIMSTVIIPSIIDNSQIISPVHLSTMVVATTTPTINLENFELNDFTELLPPTPPIPPTLMSPLITAPPVSIDIDEKFLTTSPSTTNEFFDNIENDITSSVINNSIAHRRARLKSISLDSESARLVEDNLGIPVEELVDYNNDNRNLMCGQNKQNNNNIQKRTKNKNQLTINLNEKDETLIINDDYKLTKILTPKTPTLQQTRQKAVSLDSDQINFQQQFNQQHHQQFQYHNHCYQQQQYHNNQQQSYHHQHSQYQLPLIIPQQLSSISVPTTPKRQQHYHISHYQQQQQQQSQHMNKHKITKILNTKMNYYDIPIVSSPSSSVSLTSVTTGSSTSIATSPLTQQQQRSKIIGGFTRKLGSFDENIVDYLIDDNNLIDCDKENIFDISTIKQSGNNVSNLQVLKTTLSVSNNNLKTLPEVMTLSDFDIDDNNKINNLPTIISTTTTTMLPTTPLSFLSSTSLSSTTANNIITTTTTNMCSSNNKVRNSILQRRGSNHSLTLNLDGSICNLTKGLSTSNYSLGNLQGSHYNLSSSSYNLNTGINNIISGNGGGIGGLCSGIDGNNSGNGNCPIGQIGSNNNLRTKKNLLQRRGSNTSLTLNIQSSNLSLNRFNSHSSLNILHSNNERCKKGGSSGGGGGSGGGLLERRNSNASLTLNIQNRSLSISNSNLRDSACSLNSINTNINQQDMIESNIINYEQNKNINQLEQQQLLPKHQQQQQHHQLQQQQLLQLQQQHQHRKFLSSENLNISNSINLHKQHQHGHLQCGNYGSIDDLKRTTTTSSSSLLSSTNQTINNMNNVNDIIDIEFQNNDFNCASCCCCSGTSGIRNITTKPLSPQSTSEDFKIYLANIQFLQNATNMLNHKNLRNLSYVFDKSYQHLKQQKQQKQPQQLEQNVKQQKIQSKHNLEQENQQNVKKLSNSNIENDINDDVIITDNYVDDDDDDDDDVDYDGDDAGNMDNYNDNNEEEEEVEDDDDNDKPPTEDEQKLILRNLHQEFWDLPTNYQEKPLVFGSQAKNRYKTILPNEHSRVLLKSELGSTILEPYINANYIKGPDYTNNCYIATQGPMPNTIYEFWLMIYQNVRLNGQKPQQQPEEEQYQKIVMLTDFVENGRQKCAIYFPTELGQILAFTCNNNLDDTSIIEERSADIMNDEVTPDFHTNCNYFLIKNMKIIQKNGYSIRKLAVYYCNNHKTINNDDNSYEDIDDNNSDNNEINNKCNFFVYHYWFPDWPDHRSPEDIDVLLDMSLDLLDGNCVFDFIDGNVNVHEHDNDIEDDYDEDIDSTDDTDDNNEDECDDADSDIVDINMYQQITNQDNCDNNLQQKINDDEIIIQKNQLKLKQNLEKFEQKTMSTIDIINKQQQSVILPIIHCSAGIGRTGCLAAILNGLRQIRQSITIKNKNYYIFNTINVDVLGIVCNLRLQRGGMVQNSEQYELIHRALCLYQERLINKNLIDNYKRRIKQQQQKQQHKRHLIQQSQQRRRDIIVETTGQQDVKQQEHSNIVIVDDDNIEDITQQLIKIDVKCYDEENLTDQSKIDAK